MKKVIWTVLQGLYSSFSTTLAILLGLLMGVAIIFPIGFIVYWITTLVSPSIQMVDWWYWLLLGFLPDLWLIGKFSETQNS